MKGALLILAGGILFTGVFIGGFVTGGLLVCAAEDATKSSYTQNGVRYSSYPFQEKYNRPYTDSYTGGDDIPEADK